MKIDKFFAKKGKQVWYVALTNEILVNRTKGQTSKEYEVIMTLKKQEIKLGPAVYLGEL